MGSINSSTPSARNTELRAWIIEHQDVLSEDSQKRLFSIFDKTSGYVEENKCQRTRQAKATQTLREQTNRETT